MEFTALLKLSLPYHFAHLLVLAPCAVQKMRHVHYAAVAGGQKRRRHRDVADIPAGHFEASRHEVEIKVGALRSFLGPDLFPDAAPVAFIGKRELDREVKATNEGVIHVLAEVGGQNDHTFMLFHLLK